VAFAGEIAEGMEHKGKVCFGFWGKNTGRGKAVIVNEGGDDLTSILFYSPNPYNYKIQLTATTV
jgi:hypothetical protein